MITSQNQIYVLYFLSLLHSNHGHSKSFPTELSFSQRAILGTQGEIICFMKRIRILLQITC